MFGYPCAFVGGNMACGLHQDDVVLRLGDDGEKGLGGKPFEPMAGRPMRGYFTAPPAVLADREALAGWVKRAIEHTATLPPKVKKAAAKATVKPAPKARPRAAAKPSAKPAAKASAPAKKKSKP